MDLNILSRNTWSPNYPWRQGHRTRTDAKNSFTVNQQSRKSLPIDPEQSTQPTCLKMRTFNSRRHRRRFPWVILMYDIPSPQSKTPHLLRYSAYVEEGKERFNRIGVDDFWYMEKLGEGAFGKVVGPSPVPSQRKIRSIHSYIPDNPPVICFRRKILEENDVTGKAFTVLYEYHASDRHKMVLQYIIASHHQVYYFSNAIVQHSLKSSH